MVPQQRLLKEMRRQNKAGDRVMKIATNVIVAAALVLASAPAFAHGGGMGGNLGGNMGMGHGNVMTVNTKNVTNVDKTTFKTKTFFLKHLELVRIQRDIRRLDRIIFRLIKDGKGDSPLVKALEFQRLKLISDEHVS
jgi:hypothetical protein